MERAGRNARRKVVRKERADVKRRESLVADYVQNKYNDIYVEATQFYNMLNHLHPDKHDLKKTDEYRVWKNNVRRDLIPSLFNIHRQAPRPSPSIPDRTEQTQSEHASPSPPSPDRTEQTRPEHAYVDNLQLRIPLMNNITTQRKSTVTTETLETSTEETPAAGDETLKTLTEGTLDPGVIEPSLDHQIPHEMIEKIVEELRGDPDLQHIFSTIEEEIEFEQLAIDLEIFEHDLLEKELENW